MGHRPIRRRLWWPATCCPSFAWLLLFPLAISFLPEVNMVEVTLLFPSPLAAAPPLPGFMSDANGQSGLSVVLNLRVAGLGVRSMVICMGAMWPFRRLRSSVRGHLPAVVDHLDQRREILARAATVDEALVELLGFAAHRRVGAGFLGRFHRQLEVLEHQCRREAAVVIAVGRGFRTDAGDRTVTCLVGKDGGDVEGTLKGAKK